MDGGLGDDVMYLRWSPWLSPNEQGIQVSGGSGKDLFVFSGLDGEIPDYWDGSSGLPSLNDFDLSYDITKGIGLTDRIGSVKTPPTSVGSQKPLYPEFNPQDISGVCNILFLHQRLPHP